MTAKSEFTLAIQEALEKAVLAERERCAKVCESRQSRVSNGNGVSYQSFDAASVEAGYCADSIRKG